MRITILIDNKASWMHRFVAELQDALENEGHTVLLCRKATELQEGDIAFFLSCVNIVAQASMAKHKNNIVIHASDLPLGRGWSPSTWQILEGKGRIPISCFEAADGVDSGEVYFKDYIELEGTELVDEWRAKLGQKVNEMALRYVRQYPLQGTKQEGEPSYYPKRILEDSRLDTEKSIAEQFNLLRVVDNELYPAYFVHKGKKYIVRIYPAHE